MNILLVAVDAGPRQVLCELAETFFDLLIVNRKVVSLESIDILVVGTSGSVEGRAVEGEMRRMAVQASIPLVVIEDYPGNFFSLPDAEPDLLIVEHEFVTALHRRALGAACPPIQVYGNPRYDSFRARHREMARQIQRVWEADSYTPSILWAGQPETEDALATLSRILPDIRQFQVRLLLKAHPRDRGYGEGAYQELFQKFEVPFLDVTSLSLESCCLQHAPLAVLTQFSSLATEAGFYLIPSAHILYGDVGGQRLLHDKSYQSPPWCECGASVLIDDESRQYEQLHSLLNDKKHRDDLCTGFFRYWGTEQTAQRVASSVRSCFLEGVLQNDT